MACGRWAVRREADKQREFCMISAADGEGVSCTELFVLEEMLKSKGVLQYPDSEELLYSDSSVVFVVETVC